MIASKVLATVLSQWCFSPASNEVAVREVKVPLPLRVFVFGRQGLILLDPVKGPGRFVSMDGNPVSKLPKQMLLGGRRQSKDTWLHLAKAGGSEEMFRVSGDGELKKESPKEYDPCLSWRTQGADEVCVNGVLVSRAEREVLVRRPSGFDLHIASRAGFRREPGLVADIILIHPEDVLQFEQVPELQGHVSPLPESAIESFQCATRACWAIGADGQVLYRERAAGRWRVVGHVAPKGSYVVVGGEEKGVLYDDRCPGVLTAISPLTEGSPSP